MKCLAIEKRLHRTSVTNLCYVVQQGTIVTVARVLIRAHVVEKDVDESMICACLQRCVHRRLSAVILRVEIRVWMLQEIIDDQ